jgi:large subunit ribosomal protein L19e
MANLEMQRNIAARVLKCGKSRVWFDPERINDVEDAITSADVIRLAKEGAIRKMQKQGVSAVRKKKTALQKSKGRRKGHGSRKGYVAGREKKDWMKRIRTIRKMLKDFRDAGRLEKRAYRQLYMQSKSGFFRSKSHLMTYMERNNLLKEKK